MDFITTDQFHYRGSNLEGLFLLQIDDFDDSAMLQKQYFHTAFLGIELLWKVCVYASYLLMVLMK